MDRDEITDALTQKGVPFDAYIVKVTDEDGKSYTACLSKGYGRLGAIKATLSNCELSSVDTNKIISVNVGEAFTDYTKQQEAQAQVFDWLDKRKESKVLRDLMED